MAGRGFAPAAVSGMEDHDEANRNPQGFPRIFVANEVTKTSPPPPAQNPLQQLPHNLRQRRKASTEVMYSQHPSVVAKGSNTAPTAPNNNSDAVRYSTPVASNKGQKWSEHFFIMGKSDDGMKKASGTKATEADSGFLELSPSSINSSACSVTSPDGKAPMSVGGGGFYVPSPQPYVHLQDNRDLRKKLNQASKRLFNADDGSAGVLLQFWTDFKKRPHEIVPIIILLVVATSAVVSVCTLSNAIRRGPTSSSKGDVVEGNVIDNLNGKYKSIEYGHQKQWMAVEPQSGDKAGRILDEDGEPLGGKRASLKFGFDLRKASGGRESGQEPLQEGQTEDNDDDDDGMDLKASIALLEELKQVAQMLAKDEETGQGIKEEVRRDTLDRLKSIKRPVLPPSSKPLGSFRGAKDAKKADVDPTQPSPSPPPPLSLKKRRAPKSPNKALQEGPFGFQQETSRSVKAGGGALKDEDDPFRM